MKAIHVFVDVDLRCGHWGLMDMALKKKVKVTELEPGQAVLFINKSGTGMKAYLSHRIVAYMKAEVGHTLTVAHLNAIVDAVQPGGRMQANAKIKTTLSKILRLPPKERPGTNKRLAA